ncbi:hypothetical protein [Moritella viscosa]|uniref:Uncharacterized protein n=1 Tax=Moritella viscosa TaxID=80854 RepID=A0A090KCU0_9GAMM|nr:hypothetical protein [Moritella viscosa]CED61688.1 membrane protein [Moritella viscosa]SGY90358.1 Putative uncharacterized protein [Moritella viscosa]SGY94259.1 Putative uncharacterized protein [Moritella viscosa]SGY94635.1 Putative uncharacterized protein [Moritella viscosa]SGY98897.1 Putative uncharacterized protein [Moritella viscosa]
MVKGKNNDNPVNTELVPHEPHLATNQTTKYNKDGKSNGRNRFLKRQTSLLIALSLSSLFIFIAVSLYNNVTASRYHQVDMFVHSLLDYPTKMAANLIVARESTDRNTRVNSKNQLQQLVDEVSENPYVTSLHIFAENGKLLSSSQEDYMAELLAKKQYVVPKGVRVYLKPILADNKPVGFLQLHFSYQQMLKTFTIFQFDATKSILILFLLLLLFGVIIGVTINRVHHKFRSKG